MAVSLPSVIRTSDLVPVRDRAIAVEPAVQISDDSADSLTFTTTLAGPHAVSCVTNDGQITLAGGQVHFTQGLTNNTTGLILGNGNLRADDGASGGQHREGSHHGSADPEKRCAQCHLPQRRKPTEIEQVVINLVQNAIDMAYSG